MLRLMETFIQIYNEFETKLENYLSKYKRLLYSEISVFIYSILDQNESKSSNFLENIDNSLSSALAKDSVVENNTTKIILKLWDHVNLAYKQYSELKLNDKSFQERINPVIEDINETKKNIFTQLISIVSIFVAIAFVMFGGMSLINGLFDFSNMDSIPIVELAFLGSLIGIVMVSVMYAFIIFAIRLSIREFRGKSPFRKTYILSITALMCICIFTFSWWIVDNSDKSIVIQKYFPWIILEGIILLIIFTIFVWIIIKISSKDENNK